MAFLDEVFPRKSRLVLDTISIFGFILFIFLIGVKIDPSMVLRPSKKALAVGILGFFLPFGLAASAVFLLDRFSALDKNISRALPHILAMQSMTAFPVITCFLDELKILNSDIGRLASSSSVICDVCLWSFIFIKFAADLARTKSLSVIIGSLLSGVLFVIFVIKVIRPAALWVVRHTREGRPVKEIYIFLTLVGVLSTGFIGEAIGIHATVASLVLGLVIPDGPPLGAALVETLDCFVTILMPLFFTICGLQMDIFSIQNLKNFGVLQLVIFVAFIGKIMGTMLPLIFCRMPIRDALSLGLIMNTKGIVEIAFLNDFKKQDVSLPTLILGISKELMYRTLNPHRNQILLLFSSTLKNSCILSVTADHDRGNLYYYDNLSGYYNRSNLTYSEDSLRSFKEVCCLQETDTSTFHKQ